MRLKEIKKRYIGNVFDVLSDQELVVETDEWAYYLSIPINGIIAMGWFLNDDILIINADGIYVYDLTDKHFIFRDYETPLKNDISADNLTFFVKSRSETVSIFGLRGGGGNLLTSDNVYALKRINLSWNVNVPRLSNYQTKKVYFLELYQNNYEGCMHLGFSKSEEYFAIMGDGGVDVFYRKK